MGETDRAVFFGELLMRLGTQHFERLVQSRELEIGFTGAEANAAVSLVNFGLRSSVVSVVPDNELGQACLNYLQQFGGDVSHVLRFGPRLGTFYLETGVSQRPSKVIYDRAASSITQLAPGRIDWDKVLDSAKWFHFSGTAPALSESMAATVAEACAAAKRMKLTVSCDLNYRRKLWSPEEAQTVMIPLMRNVDVLIGNEEDSMLVLGVVPKGVDVTSGRLDNESYRETTYRLHERFGFRYVATTLRESHSASENGWSGVLSDGKTFYQSRKYDIRIVDRVGAGDAFSGGLIYSSLTGMDCQAMVEFATAASCLKHSIHGDLNLVSLAEVSTLLRGHSSEHIQS